MNHEKSTLLNFLLNRYESSALQRTGNSTRKTAISLSAYPGIQEINESPSRKVSFLAALSELQSDGIITIKWQKFQEGNITERIYLESVDQAYAAVKRKPMRKTAEEFIHLLDTYIKEIPKDSDLYQYLFNVRNETERKKKISGKFSENLKLNEDILKLFVYLSRSHDDQMERVLSTGLYGDSKYFERILRSRVLNIFREIYKAKTGETPEDNFLLEERGIIRWPEIFEFCGNVKAVMDDDREINYSLEQYGAYMNSLALTHVISLQPGSVKRVISIENKANYVWYVSNVKKENELVLFHGGVYSPAKRKWLTLISEGLEQGAEVFHWSDIDAGGFRIFHRLKNNIFPGAQPYLINETVLENNQEKCKPLGSNHYKSILEGMLKDSSYQIFHSTIRYMLENNVKLEQENLIA